MKVFLLLTLVAVAAAAVAPKFDLLEDGAYEVREYLPTDMIFIA